MTASGSRPSTSPARRRIRSSSASSRLSSARCPVACSGSSRSSKLRVRGTGSPCRYGSRWRMTSTAMPVTCAATSCVVHPSQWRGLCGLPRSLQEMGFAVSGCFRDGVAGVSWCATSQTARYRDARAGQSPSRDPALDRPLALSQYRSPGMGITAWIVLILAAGPLAKMQVPGRRSHGLMTCVSHVSVALPGGWPAREVVPRGHRARVLQPVHIAYRHHGSGNPAAGLPPSPQRQWRRPPVVTQPGAPVNGQDGRARRRGVGPASSGARGMAPLQCARSRFIPEVLMSCGSVAGSGLGPGYGGEAVPAPGWSS